MTKVWVIVAKEWAEVFRNKLVLWTVVATPLVFLLLAVGTMAFTSKLPGEELANDPDADVLLGQLGALCEGLDAADCMQLYMASIYLMLFLMVPALLPSVFASYSVVGEKNARTLEPLLATPIHTWELLLGKCIAAVVPGLAATWLGVGLYAVALAVLAPAVVVEALFSGPWLVAIFGVSPLLAGLSVLASLLVSSRVSDPRSAQQISAFVILPVLMAFMGQSLGMFMVDNTSVALTLLVLSVVDLALTWATVRLFDREAILTRWSG